MNKTLILACMFGYALLACTPQPRTYTTAEAQAKCLDEKRDAEGPRGEVTLGATSKGAGFGGVSISVNDKYLRGVDPDAVYTQCMQKLTIVD